MSSQEQAIPRKKDPFGDSARKLGLLLLMGLLATVLYFPNLTFRGYEYSPGEVARTDVKSPVEAAGQDVIVRKGEIVVREGQVVTASEIRKLKAIESSVRRERSSLPALGFFALTAALISASYYFSKRNIRKFSSSPKDLLLMGTVLAGVLVLLNLSDTAALVMTDLFPGSSSVYRYIVPVAVGPMLVRLLLNSETAFVFAAVSSVIAGYFVGGLDMAAFALAGGMAGAAGVRHCTHRSIVIKAGLLLGAVNAAVLLCVFSLKGTLLDSAFQLAATGVLNGVIASILAIGLAPVLEVLFQYTTDIRLLELSRMEHPLLKELAIKAPGTYHHSLVIGTLAEAAAESINANPLLARVGAYYHDIGKVRMPQYFIENTSGENRHDKLSPSMSSLILSSHVKEGVELARRYRLGSEITDIVGHHHGTALITYFYRKAKAEEGELEVREGDYRYPGPKPQTKEAGIVMLADAIEAASKTLPDPTPDRVQWLTQKIVNKIFSDGQLDECELTLKDLHAITRSFNRVFAGMYHQRIEYPETVDILKEKDFEGPGPGKKGSDSDKKDGRGRLRRLGV
ncbi:MAG TPA: hypothetical protein DDW94_05260 [Deltaproteobacteria bacterium]|nr:MAG: hypothetical protein A2Z79_04695 [Deltaproteobacteria bacterium GWA2_55_82]OGQ61979.1 MAG: hypothetical protein A3I81_13220 [Deltaproteobacteria bacterium RIFCSPLOWO2_02_FULL_55_12]OIJ74674.1 MAG: hypothetical protein A2V21_310605 [Deltaproteobacteria bacterium GWC2_55_46]HBG46382.1 hypothetical protein [Deltaproteobacteria bacterium]HCY10593.1 hypothetical protein [Deltaproteobacteria bacterium]